MSFMGVDCRGMMNEKSERRCQILFFDIVASTTSRGMEKMGEHRVAGLLNFVVLAAVAAVAYTDWIIVADVSLGYLYVLPISISGLVNPLPFTLALGVICTILSDMFGPPTPSLYWRIVHNAVYL